VDDEILAARDERELTGVWRARLPDTTVLLADLAGTPAGFASLAVPALSIYDRTAGEITALYVAPAHWRRGVGRALVAAAGAEMRAEGCDDAILWVFEGNERARAFYAAVGFTDDGRRTVHQPTGLPELLLRLRLAD
jgi:GNAT superfamily N-acetyltransferase